MLGFVFTTLKAPEVLQLAQRDRPTHVLPNNMAVRALDVAFTSATVKPAQVNETYLLNNSSVQASSLHSSFSLPILLSWMSGMHLTQKKEAAICFIVVK